MTKTPTWEAKEIIINLLKGEPEKEFTIGEIKNELSQKATMMMTEGTISGAIYTLSKDPKCGVVNVSRGVYSWNPTSANDKVEVDLTQRLYEGVDESIDKLEHVANAINVLDIEEKDIPILQKMKTLINDLKKFNEELMETYGSKINN